MVLKKTKEIHFVVENLIKIRNERKLNQLQFSELIGIDYSIYNKIESGYLQLSLDKLSKIANKLQMREIDIFTHPAKYVELSNKESNADVLITLKLKKDLKEKVLDLITENNKIEIIT